MDTNILENPMDVSYIIPCNQPDQFIIVHISTPIKFCYEDSYLLEYNAMWSVESQQTFWRNIWTQSSRSKNNPTNCTALYLRTTAVRFCENLRFYKFYYIIVTQGLCLKIYPGFILAQLFYIFPLSSSDKMEVLLVYGEFIFFFCMYPSLGAGIA
jgi:hypothetical protein